MKITRVDQVNLALSTAASSTVFLCVDGGILCLQAAQQEASLIRDAIIASAGCGHSVDQWRVFASCTNRNYGELRCDHLGTRIPLIHLLPESTP